MRATVIVMTLLTISLATLAVFMLSTAGPRLSVASDLADFGDLDPNEQARMTIHIGNEGDGELRIERVWVACGCASAYLEKEVIPPYGKVPLTIQVRALGSGSNKEIPLILVSNDRTHPHKEITIRYNVVRATRLAEREIYFGRVGRSELPETKSVLYSCDRQERERLFRILSSESDLGFLQIRHKESSTLRDIEIEVTVSEAAPDGEILSDMWVRVDGDPRPKRSSIKIIGYVRGDLVAIPSSITIRARDDAVVSVQSRNPGETVRVVDIALTNNMNDNIIVENQSAQSAETQQLHVRLKRDNRLSPGSRLLGTIVVSVEVDPDGRLGKVAIPVAIREVGKT